MPGGVRVAVGVGVPAGGWVGDGTAVSITGLGDKGSGVSGWGWLTLVEGVSVATRPIIRAATVNRLNTTQVVL